VGKLPTLHKQREIDELFKTGRRCRGRHLLVVVAGSPSGEGRVLFPVGRKVGKAVARNRIRRRLREAYRSVSPRLREGLDVAIVAHPTAAEAGYWELQAEVVRLLTKAGALAPAMP